MIHPSLLAQHLEFSLWASLQVLEAARSLPEDALQLDRGNSFGGILSTLAHIFQADRLWLKRFQNPGQAAGTLAQPGESFHLDLLAEQWPGVLRDFATWTKEQSPEALAEPLHWINLKGEAKSEKRYKILLHIVNHGTYHRGQVVTMLKQAGVAVPSTDLVYYPGM
ncbi:MAG: DinB family protein [Bryobacter sp.]|nr:DinB family protein [Bryobacter sp.]